MMAGANDMPTRDHGLFVEIMQVGPGSIWKTAVCVKMSILLVDMGGRDLRSSGDEQCGPADQSEMNPFYEIDFLTDNGDK